MKFSANQFEAVLRQKRQATGEAVRPAKKAQRRGQAKPAQAAEAPVVPALAEEPTREVPAKGAVPEPAGTEVEEGKIPATIEAVVVVVDLEEDEVPATADMPEAGQVTIARGPPATAEPKVERAPPSSKEREAVVERPKTRTEIARKWRDEPGGSSRRLRHRPSHPRAEGPQEGPTRLAPRLGSMADAGWAADLLSKVRTAESDEEVRGLSHSAVLDLVMVSIVQMAHDALALRDALCCSGDALAKAMMQADKYKKESAAQSQSLARLHQEAKAQEENLCGRVREAESRASAAEAKLAVVSARLEAAVAWSEELVRQLEQAEGQAEVMRNEALAASQRATAAERAVVKAGHEKAEAMAHADEASTHTKEDEGRAWEAEAQAKEAEAKAQQAEAQAKEAEARAQQAEAGAGQAIASYKSSPEFAEEVIEASLDAYVKGFKMCKTKVASALKIDISELEGIQAEDPDEGPAEEEEDEEELGPSES